MIRRETGETGRGGKELEESSMGFSEKGFGRRIGMRN
jgi:hypothetical protein